MDSLEKKLGQLTPQLRKEVEDFVDLLILKYERQAKKEESVVKRETKKETKSEKIEPVETTTPVESEPSAPPPIKRSMAFTRVEMMGNKQYTSSITQKLSATNQSQIEKVPELQKPANFTTKSLTTDQKSGEQKAPNTLNLESKVTSTTESDKPKSEMLGEREIEVERQLFPCPFCKNVVQDNWDECPFCNKSLIKTAEPTSAPKKKWFK